MASNFNPILNILLDEPKKHYRTLTEGSFDYEKLINCRRVFIPAMRSIPMNPFYLLNKHFYGGNKDEFVGLKRGLSVFPKFLNEIVRVIIPQYIDIVVNKIFMIRQRAFYK